MGPPGPRGDPFLELWQGILVRELDLMPIARVVPIDKRHIVTMDPGSVPMSGASIGLDELILREIDGDGVDAAVVAWDLLPPWNSEAKTCRWSECLALYQNLSRSEVLPASWRENAGSRYAELQRRSRPGARSRQPRLASYSILTVCMEPMFEAVLMTCEAGVRRALGVSGRRIPDWPRWSTRGAVDRNVLQRALLAAKRVRPWPRVFGQIRGDFVNAKHEWAEHLLRKLFADERCRDQVLQSPICRRMAELMGRNSERSRPIPT